MKSRSCCQLRLVQLLLFIASSNISAAVVAAAKKEKERDTVPLPRLLRAKDIAINNHQLDDHTAEEESIPWHHPSRILNPSTTCPWPDDITSLTDVRSGQYGSETGDCFYMYYDPSKCDILNGNDNKCPLYIYIDGTENAADIDERDTTYMIEMAQRGYVAVTVDYDDLTLGYTDGCDGFHEKSKKIFDGSVTGSVIHQLCYENSFGHRDVIPVDCSLGVVVNGWSQGGHVASLAGNYAPSFITAGLFWANGNYNLACAFDWSTCLTCISTDVSCMNSNSVDLPKEKRRNIGGEQDSFFGACEDWWGANNRENVIDQLREISGYSCAYSQDNCFNNNLNQAGYYVIPGKGHSFLNVDPSSEFMDPATEWGLPQNFDWLAAQGLVSPPSGVCSSNSGVTAGNSCSDSSECQCGRRVLHASENADEEGFLSFAASSSGHRGLQKNKKGGSGGGGGGGGGKKTNPPSPTPPATQPPSPAPTNVPSSDFCGCEF